MYQKRHEELTERSYAECCGDCRESGYGANERVGERFGLASPQEDQDDDERKTLDDRFAQPEDGSRNPDVPGGIGLDRLDGRWIDKEPSAKYPHEYPGDVCCQDGNEGEGEEAMEKGRSGGGEGLRAGEE